MASDMINLLTGTLQSHELRQGIQDVLDQPTDDIPPLPAALKRSLQAQATRLEELYTQVQRERPQGDFDFAQLAHDDVSLPQFDAHRDLTLLLVADILDKTRQGKTREALEALVAAWTINASPRQHPVSLSQQIAMQIDTILAKVMRKMYEVPPAWQPRLLAHD